MIVYVESNFILEIVLAQEQHLAAETILSMAEMHEVELVFPGFILGEVFSTVVRRQKERSELYTSLEKTLGQIKRSENSKDIAFIMEPLVIRLKEAFVVENDVLYSTIKKMLSVGRAIETDLDSLTEVQRYQEQSGLSLPDSIIYSTIINDLKKRPANEEKRFLSRDAKAYSDDSSNQRSNKIKPDVRLRIESELRNYKCRYFPSFDNALGNIKAYLDKNNV